jgi:hypothetical protein
MNDDKWAEAYNRLTSALEYAREVGMTDTEIEDCVQDTVPSETPHVGGGPKRPKEYDGVG